MKSPAFNEVTIGSGESTLLTTDVPPTVALFDLGISEGPQKIDEQWKLGYAFNPEALDQLESGTYTVRTRTRTGRLPVKQCITQAINLMPSEHGMTVDTDSFGRNPFPETVRPTNRIVAPLMALIGYKHDAQDNITGIPTPRTVQHAVAPHVPVQLYPGKGNLDARTYVDSFAKGTFPVATGKQRLFIHDICDDHLTAMILGGEPLMTTLQEAATSHQADNEIGNAARCIDLYTGFVRSAVIDDDRSRIYGKESSELLHKAGRGLGIPPHVTDDIETLARDTARSYNIPVSAFYAS